LSKLDCLVFDAGRLRQISSSDVTPIAAPLPMRAIGLIWPLSIPGVLPGAYTPGELNAVYRRSTRFSAVLPTPLPLPRIPIT